jgi:hypothetical protein
LGNLIDSKLDTSLSVLSSSSDPTESRSLELSERTIPSPSDQTANPMHSLQKWSVEHRPVQKQKNLQLIP